MSKGEAIELLKAKWPQSTLWPNIPVAELRLSLQERVEDPNKIRQRKLATCGPAAFIYSLAAEKPADYVRFAHTLYVSGKAYLGSFKVKPSKACRDYTPAGPGQSYSCADWLTIAGLRDSSNFIFDLQSDHMTSLRTQAGSLTLPSQMEEWLREGCGYTSVENHTNLLFTKGQPNLKDASDKRAAGWIVYLFINAKVCDANEYQGTSTVPTHWVALTDKIRRYVNGKNEQLVIEMYSWGKDVSAQLPSNITLKEFLRHYYGYVAGNPASALQVI